MSPEKRKLIVVGDSAFAQVAFEYFSVDTSYETVAFAVEKAFLTRSELLGVPVVAVEDLAGRFAAADHSFFAAIVYTERNRLRRRLYRSMKELGYSPASYISPRACVWRNVVIGEHVFLFENNVVQPFAALGDNVVLWSGNHVGHHSKIESDVFVSSHVVISGFANIGESSFLGVNSTIGNNVSVGADCVIAAGALVLGDVPDSTTVVGAWRGKRPALDTLK